MHVNTAANDKQMLPSCSTGLNTNGGLAEPDLHVFGAARQWGNLAAPEINCLWRKAGGPYNKSSLGLTSRHRQ